MLDPYTLYRQTVEKEFPYTINMLTPSGWWRAYSRPASLTEAFGPGLKPFGDIVPFADRARFVWATGAVEIRFRTEEDRVAALLILSSAHDETKAPPRLR